MESDLAKTWVKLEQALEWVKVVHQMVTVDLPRVVEVSFLCSSLAPWSFHRLSQHDCFLLCRPWRRCRAASLVFSGRSTLRWSERPWHHGGLLSLSAS